MHENKQNGHDLSLENTVTYPNPTTQKAIKQNRSEFLYTQGAEAPTLLVYSVYGFYLKKKGRSVKRDARGFEIVWRSDGGYCGRNVTVMMSVEYDR